MTEFPLPKFHFQVNWGGTRMQFQEISGLSVEVDVIEYREGASPEFSPIKMPGLRKYGNITLKRGIVKGDNEFFQWWNTIQLHKVERRDITISLLDENHEPVVVWKIKNAFPVKIVWSDLKASASELALESLEIACEGIIVENE
ncbi:phage tail-like protein [Catalinimonas alkaloidigena]|uniref:phage tail protein n=1 Tax=Catalinimonas alkaloidigena TaxID=1075417 RepID=UPI002407613B|nr:phage tail protein [Catalinimonas alkaloidigena]MDF9800287.1 phage tail-like protein [Catalinimonas alkaloidigena]